MKKYYIDIELYNDKRKYGIVGDSFTSRKDMIDMVKDFAKELDLICNTKTKKLFNKKGEEVGIYTLTSQVI